MSKSKILAEKLKVKPDFELSGISFENCFLKMFLILKKSSEKFVDTNLAERKIQKIKRLLVSIGKTLPQNTLILFVLANCSPKIVKK